MTDEEFKHHVERTMRQLGVTELVATLLMTKERRIQALCDEIDELREKREPWQ